jgi:6-phosphogluconolactonase
MKKNAFSTFVFTGLLAFSAFGQKIVPFYVGTGDKTENSVITLCELNLSTGQIARIDTFYNAGGPGYVAVSPNKKNLYAVSGANSITSYAIGADKKLTRLNSQSSEGVNPCHVSVHPSGKMAFSANYTGGSFTAYTLQPDGKVNPATYTEQYVGTGPNTKRQEKAHAHFATASPDGKYVYVTDLGSDKIMNYIVDLKTGKLTPNPAQPFFVAKPGSGPRHLVIHPSGKSLFLLNELEASLTACSINKQGVITALETYPTVPDGLTGNTSAAIHLHPNGKFVYVSNRGYNSISAFKIKGDGSLEKVDEIKKSISIPRDFNIDPTGKFMVVANQDTHNLVVYDVNSQTGKLTFRSESIGIKAPICVAFL